MKKSPWFFVAGFLAIASSVLLIDGHIEKMFCNLISVVLLSTAWIIETIEEKKEQ